MGLNQGDLLRYLVTGGAGFIGSHLADFLAARGDSVLVLDDLSTGRRDNLADAFGSGVEMIEGSVTDPEVVDSCIRDVDRCFHLASAVGVRLIVDSPSSSITRNIGGTEIVSAAAA